MTALPFFDPRLVGSIGIGLGAGALWRVSEVAGDLLGLPRPHQLVEVLRVVERDPCDKAQSLLCDPGAPPTRRRWPAGLWGRRATRRTAALPPPLARTPA